MKNTVRTMMLLCLTLTLASWGKVGHYTVGRIAEKHLSAKAKLGIYRLIGNTSLADISTYADDVRQQKAYKYTFYFHFIDLPVGLSQQAFNKAVVYQTKDNVYSALLKFSNDLIAPGNSKATKVFALKMIVHLVGDLHQPMHVSREKDQGGNKIPVSFLGKSTNLHSMWDSKMIDHSGITERQLAVKIDHATSKQIKQWQQDSILKWLYESYSASTQLYKDAAKYPHFNEVYYKAHLPLIESRLEKGGIRLAGILNEIFGGGPYKIVPAPVVRRY
jgi:hypothetical protein